MHSLKMKSTEGLFLQLIDNCRRSKTLVAGTEALAVLRSIIYFERSRRMTATVAEGKKTSHRWSRIWFVNRYKVAINLYGAVNWKCFARIAVIIIGNHLRYKCLPPGSCQLDSARSECLWQYGAGMGKWTTSREDRLGGRCEAMHRIDRTFGRRSTSLGGETVRALGTCLPRSLNWHHCWSIWSNSAACKLPKWSLTKTIPRAKAKTSERPRMLQAKATIWWSLSIMSI